MEEPQKRPSYYNIEHQRKYHQKIKKLTINFNLENEEDVKILDFLNSQDNKSAFIKELVKNRM
ncbi:MAG: hypothetical protein ACK5LY_01035 [Lachnospirales bacterium]